MSLFASPEILWLLLLLLPLGLLFWLVWRIERQDRRALGDDQLVGALLDTPAEQRRELAAGRLPGAEELTRVRARASRRRLMRAGMLLATVALIVLALARPRFGFAEENLVRQGLQVMVVLDGSKSMNVEDISPNRFEAAKRLVARLLQRMDGSQFGLIVFGNASRVQFPMTSDLAAARSLLEPLSTASLNSPGSNVARALEEAQRSFAPGQTQGRVVLLLTDGGDPEQDPQRKALEQARKMGSAGIMVHSVGMGTSAGGPIPYIDERGRLSYKEDPQGNQVISQLNAEPLRQISSQTGGSYFEASDVEIEQLVAALERGAPIDLSERRQRPQQERFQLAAALALLLLAGEYLLLGRRRL